MNRDNAKEYLPLVKALSEGKTIQKTDGRGGALDLQGDIRFDDSPDRYRIKPMDLLLPPIPFVLHNPDNLTAEQVGEGYRLLCDAEVDGKLHKVQGASLWYGDQWVEPGGTVGTYEGELYWNEGSCVRVPASLPWPDKKEPEWIPLGPEDVPWGSVLTSDGGAYEFLVVGRGPTGLIIGSRVSMILWPELLEYWSIKRPGETEWTPCKKIKP